MRDSRAFRHTLVFNKCENSEILNTPVSINGENVRPVIIGDSASELRDYDQRSE